MSQNSGPVTTGAARGRSFHIQPGCWNQPAGAWYKYRVDRAGAVRGLPGEPMADFLNIIPSAVYHM
jgi:hypothetical protein